LFKAVAAVLVLICAATSYFMVQYAVVIDSSMLLNALHTDAREVADLWSWSLMLWLAAGFGGAILIWRLPLPLQALPLKRRLWTALALFGGAVVLAVLCLALMFQDFASLMRNHKSIRYQINPLNSIYAVVRLGLDQAPKAPQTLTPVGEDARLGASYASQKLPPIFVLVVGETARAANFSLGGYGQDQGRDTTPALRALQAKGDLHYFGQVTSCGTNTQASVPCMFSHHGKQAHESSKARFENLLDVLHRAGLAVLWIDNQSGCKGVCDRVPNIETRALKDERYCSNGECLDEIMLAVLDEQIASLPAERKAKGIVLVMHQMGSHGPAYYKRSPPEHKAFLPECASNALPDCSRSALLNAYDNSIRYTDHFLSQTVQWLERQQAATAMLYVSDHGESLGENNLYLHGLPYAFAPDEQKQVPMVLWFSKAMRQRQALQTACVNQQQSQALSHDHLFHSILGLLDVSTEVYQRPLDLLATCRSS
jgi:lipid A ethanolaminephosphotransferase